jgi:hypothetical protein
MVQYGAVSEGRHICGALVDIQFADVSPLTNITVILVKRGYLLVYLQTLARFCNVDLKVGPRHA